MLCSGAQDSKRDQETSVATSISMSVDIDHIFPKAWCEKHDVDANLRNSIVNKTPISYQTNRSIGGRAPASYLATLDSESGGTRPCCA